MRDLSTFSVGLLLAQAAVAQYTFPGYWFLPPLDPTTPLIYRTGCPDTISNGALCCVNSPFMYAKHLDSSAISDIFSLFPENSAITPEQQVRKAQILDPSINPNIFFNDTGYLEVSLVQDSSGYRSQVGVFLFDQNNRIIPNSMMDVFADNTLTDSQYKPASTFCHTRGDTVRLGPFPAGTRLGFYIHAGGCYTYVSSCDSNSADEGRCVRAMNASSSANKDLFRCYTRDNCFINPNLDPTNSNQFFYTIDALNGDKLRHMAIIRYSSDPNTLYIGFEDSWNCGDHDYNDAILMVTTSNVQPQLPITCSVNCDALNGACDYRTGTCKCNSANPVVAYNKVAGDCSCNCGCQNGADCNCATGKCVCPTGFSGSKCECSSDPGTCTGPYATFTCNTCTCAAGKTSSVKGITTQAGSIYDVKFGTSSASLVGSVFDYLDYGLVQQGSAVYGWTSEMRPGGRYVPQTGSSFIVMSTGVNWNINLLPSTSYDFTVVLGSDPSASSVNSLTITPLGNSAGAIAVASSLSLAASATFSRTVRITTGATNGVVSVSSPIAGTRLASIRINRAPCTCVASTSTCQNGATLNCDTGKCDCAPGYEGATCNCKVGAALCKFGTFDCASGICNCNPGYEGTNCDKKSCLPGCLVNGGTCDYTTGQCSCPVSKSGADCSCKFPQNAICQNGGTANCTSGICDCPSGFKGSDCSCKSTCPNNCSGRGTCNCDGTCSCPSTYNVDSSCNCKTPLVSACQNGGVLSCDTGICQCPSGYAGNACDQILCPKNCTGQGTCDFSNGKCSCDSAHTGSDCGCLKSTVNGQCANGVVDPLSGTLIGCGTGKCNCATGFQGDLCDCPTTCPGNCNGNGACSCGVCTCNANFTGSDCKCRKPLFSCVNGNTDCATGLCNCNSGYSGNTCSCKNCPTCPAGTKCNCNGACVCDDTLPGNTCHCVACNSTCAANGGSCNCDGTCKCPTGRLGANCELKDCGSACTSSVGFSSCDFTTGTCNCQSGYLLNTTSNTCSLKQCSVPNCNGNGVCNTSTGTCQCNALFTGQNCDVKKCSSDCVSSQGFSTCNNGTCACQPGFFGTNCQNKNCSTTCLNGGNCNYSTGTCACPSGFINADCGCKACAGGCKVNNTITLDSCNCDGTCICKPGFFGAQCQLQNCTVACLNGATCDQTTGKCSNCPAPFFGSDCGKKNCQPSCSSNGTITCDTTSGTCICRDGYFGVQCQNKNCSSTCLNGASCDYNTGTCANCPAPYFGSNCQFKNCTADGGCAFGSCDYTSGNCVCNAGYTTPDNTASGSCNCSTASCLNSCNGNGNCKCGTCQCNDGWTGPDCGCNSKAVCPNSCSGHGSCACGVCTCDNNWNGADCSIPSCPTNSKGAKCNGHGTCNANNGTCTCDVNWSGTNCTKLCILDACGVCNGDGSTCQGCDGVPGSGRVFDACNVCGGNNSTCTGCDGIPYSGLSLDNCNVCGGDGSSCRQEILCSARTSCTSCSQKSSATGKQLCGWCNDTQTCHDIKLGSCKNNVTGQISDFTQSCPKPTPPTISAAFTTNDSKTNNTSFISGIAGAVGVGCALAGGIMFSQRRKILQAFDETQWANAAVTNPLYTERGTKFENPLYKNPEAKTDDEGY